MSNCELKLNFKNKEEMAEFLKDMEVVKKQNEDNIKKNPYYYKNKKKVKNYATELIKCECGNEIYRNSFYRHKKSKIHQYNMTRKIRKPTMKGCIIEKGRFVVRFDE